MIQENLQKQNYFSSPLSETTVHGPLVIRLVESLCGTDGSAGTKANWAAATIASNTALANRAALWDAVHDAPLAHCSAAVASTPPRAK